MRRVWLWAREVVWMAVVSVLALAGAVVALLFGWETGAVVFALVGIGSALLAGRTV